jgi:hypothetical protein
MVFSKKLQRGRQHRNVQAQEAVHSPDVTELIGVRQVLTVPRYQKLTLG